MSLPSPSYASTITHTEQFESDYVSPLTTSGKFFESFYGVVHSMDDCKILVEQSIQGNIPLFTAKQSASPLRIRSGSVLVFEESCMKSFREGGKWSCSRSRGPFLMYRENFNQVHKRSYRESPEFKTNGLRPNTRLIVNGLVKRTASVIGSNGINYRVISYFYPKDVDAANPAAHLKAPSQIPALSRPVSVVRSPTPDFIVKSHSQAMSPKSPSPDFIPPSPPVQLMQFHVQREVPSLFFKSKPEQLASIHKVIGSLDSNWMSRPVFLPPLARPC
ncbi:hypothetical protein BCR33DRAFT_711221 [Rhizoclosmatium globosum]|uniref:Uncharacterized protein n=1 Tax=Rhizoclosmatium globosum TaxID=329046 RepID=A0A1Y2D3M1_9FUNG|nr:hypothetical protein BCR33DRAFT_711221 [Rhizoclosmatium globosum]|eukprot:ORY53883.1 hypothetical protein BCR33DRAFT_711221 [Rhizoclosmatium globosum]